LFVLDDGPRSACVKTRQKGEWAGAAKIDKPRPRFASCQQKVSSLQAAQKLTLHFLV
jgi:hypothetical protein